MEEFSKNKSSYKVFKICFITLWLAIFFVNLIKLIFLICESDKYYYEELHNYAFWTPTLEILYNFGFDILILVVPVYIYFIYYACKRTLIGVSIRKHHTLLGCLINSLIISLVFTAIFLFANIAVVLYFAFELPSFEGIMFKTFCNCLIFFTFVFLIIFINYIICYLIIRKKDKKHELENKSKQNVEKDEKKINDLNKGNESNKIFKVLFYTLWISLFVIIMIKIVIARINEDSYMKYYNINNVVETFVLLGSLLFYFVYSALNGKLVGISENVLKHSFLKCFLNSIKIAFIVSILAGLPFVIANLILRPVDTPLQLVLAFQAIFGFLVFGIVFLNYCIAYIIIKYKNHKKELENNKDVNETKVEE